MEDVIFEIVKKVQYGEMSIDKATNELLLLFGVSGSLPTQEEVSKAFESKIKLANNISKWAGLPQDTPTEYALKMLWFMDGCQFVYDKVKGNDR